MNENRAVVILYNGTELSSEDRIQLLKIMSPYDSNSRGSVQIFVPDPEEVAMSLVKTFTNDHSVVKEENITSPNTPEENAIIYIGEKFRSSLEKPNDFVSFVTAFSSYITSIKFTHADPEMEKAIQIIKETPILRIRDTIRSKYRISNRVIETIVRIGHYV